MLTIEKGVPVPPASSVLGLTATCRLMERGDSVFIPDRKPGQLGRAVAPLRKKEGFRYIARAVEGGARLWCVEPARKDGGQ